MSLLSRDDRMADCTARHPGLKRSFSSYANESIFYSVNDLLFNK